MTDDGPAARLSRRIDAIARSVQASGEGLAVIALGSCGLERERLDRWSDLDFFVIVAPGGKARFIEDLHWLSAAHPIVWAYRNTVDGCRALMDDGVFCEFAVFEREELSRIPYAPGRIVWKRHDVDDGIAVPARRDAVTRSGDADWLLNEALSNLYVGLSRYRRGERLSGARLVQGHAVDRVLDLVELREAPSAASRDPFSAERRFEERFPAVVPSLASFIQGYDATPRSARAILKWLASRFDVNAAMAAAIESLCSDPASS